MTMGMVPLAIQDPIRTPTVSIIKIAGMALWMLSTMPVSMSFQLNFKRKPRQPVKKAAQTSRTCGRILYTP